MTSYLLNLLGEKVIDTNKDYHNSLSIISSSGVVGLFFSASWCPPCRVFTPKLVEFYDDYKKRDNNRAERLDFELVYISSDHEQADFEEYLLEMPWFAIPFEDRKRKGKLCKKFKVTALPTLVLINPTNGEMLTRDARQNILEDPDGTKFPWKTRTLADIIGNSLINSNGSEIPVNTLDGKMLGIYFSAHWCPPCRIFTPELMETYEKINANGHKFEVIYVSRDRCQESFNNYLSTMPWLALPYSDPRIKELTQLFQVTGIPMLIIVDEQRRVITPNGRGAITEDPDGEDFPWKLKPLNELTEANSCTINQEACLILFTEGEDEDGEKAVEMLEPFAMQYAEKMKSPNQDQSLFFFYAMQDDIAYSVREFAGLEERVPMLVIIDILEQRCHISPETNITPDIIKSALEQFQNGTLPFKPLCL